MAISDILTPYADLEWVNTFLNSLPDKDNTWNQVTLSDTEKQKYINKATLYIYNCSMFYDSKNEAFKYDIYLDPNLTYEGIPIALKQATAIEAMYLCWLDDNPGFPHPLEILALEKADSKAFSHDYTPPIFPFDVKTLIESINGVVDSSAYSSSIKFIPKVRI